MVVLNGGNIDELLQEWRRTTVVLNYDDYFATSPLLQRKISATSDMLQSGGAKQATVFLQ